MKALRLLSLVAGAILILLFAVGCTKQAESDKTGTTGSTETTSGGSQTPETDPPKDTEPEPTTVDDAKPSRPAKDGEDVAVIDTDKGVIVVHFFPDVAPKHVANFKKLASEKFFDGTRFHRCIPGFMIQGGDPNSKDLAASSAWGTGGNVVNGKEVNVKAEFNETPHRRGVLSMARSQLADSASSQFFIMQADNSGLDGQYSAFGEVLKGMDVVDKIVTTGDPNNNGAVVPSEAVVVKSITIQKWPLK